MNRAFYIQVYFLAFVIFICGIWLAWGLGSKEIIGVCLMLWGNNITLKNPIPRTKETCLMDKLKQEIGIADWGVVLIVVGAYVTVALLSNWARWQ